MTTFLLQSKTKTDDDDKGDILVNLSKVMTIRGFKRESGFTLMLDYTETDRVGAFFDTEEQARETLERLVLAMGGTADDAKRYTFMEGKTKKEELADVLDTIRTRLREAS